MGTHSSGYCQRLLAWFANEPLVHFLALGAAIFLVNTLFNPGNPSAEYRIEVTAADVGRLQQIALKQWGSVPDARQMDDLVRSYVREEVLYRAALANGLDRDDVIVRRRLVQKMEFLANEQVRGPDENDLKQYFAAHANEYSFPATADFEQVYFSSDRRGAAIKADALNALEALQRGKPVQGDNFMLAERQAAQGRQAVARDFGDAFADAVFSQPAGTWFGPLRSPHGYHLLRITQRKPESPARFETVRDKVASDLVNARVAAARDAAYSKLLARYTVVLPAGRGLSTDISTHVAKR